ncbi:NAD-dependent epimerase/dehydratase family protein [Aeromicrobium sp. CTD01-1L150]|uniref:NAD-dependent epimerase/dehydratase family protein n=1 Tax=Aeromicrobium sp. CTD01-1L150 TaxID=3341830 RepID=UPI0035BF1299
MGSDALLVGCGALGSDVGQRLADAGHDVVALRRSAGLVPPALRGVSVDLTRETPSLPESQPELLVVALTARPRTEESYRATYVDGMLRALDALRGPPRRAVLVSSTAVHGDAPSVPVTDECTPPRPVDGPARMLVEAEQTFLRRLPHGTVLRLSGLYGHGNGRLQDRVRSGQIGDPDRWTNRIHRDDAAAAVVHLLTVADQPDQLYIGTDDRPTKLGEVAAFLAERLGLDPPAAPTDTPGHGKRLSNVRLRATGWVPTFPTFREGYADVGAATTP